MAKSGGSSGSIMNDFDSSSLFGGDTGSAVGNAINSYMSGNDDYGTIGNAADAFINGSSNYGDSTISSAIDSYINGSGSASGGLNIGTLGNTVSSFLGSGNGNILKNALLGAGTSVLGNASNSRLNKDRIKASYYKNPYLMGALGQPTDYTDYYADFMNNLYLNKIAQEGEAAKQRGLI